MTNATLYQISARFRARQFMPTALSDFTTDVGTMIDSGIVFDPQWSLYSLDIPGNLALFVRLPPGADLSRASFIQQAQFEAAEAALTLPLDALPALSQRLPRPDNLIFLFSIGRCGTTLANHILNTVEDTFALSEPRAFVTLAQARHSMDPDRAQALIAAAVLFMFRPPHGKAPRNFAIKFHSQTIYQAALYHRAFPQARCLFMYRDAKGWANSSSRFLQNLGAPLVLDPAALARNWGILTAGAPLSGLSATLDVSAPQTPHAPFLAAAWAHMMTQYLNTAATGVPFHTLHYDDLTTAREVSIRALLTYCDLGDTRLTEALATFDRDSQEGTDIGRGGTAKGFDVADYDNLVNALARQPHPVPSDVRL